MLKPKSNMNSTHICHYFSVACVSTIIIKFPWHACPPFINYVSVACVSTISTLNTTLLTDL